MDAAPETPTRTRRNSGQGPSNFGEEICHIVEMETPDLALCGKDVTGYPWNPPWPMCVVCVDLARTRAERAGPEGTSS